MAIFSIVGQVFKGVDSTIAIIKADILTLPVVVADPYFAVEANWMSIKLVFTSNVGYQQKTVVFKAGDEIPVSKFKASLKSRGTFNLYSITIADFDSGKLEIRRNDIPNVTNYDIQPMDAVTGAPVLLSARSVETGVQLTWAAVTGAVTYSVFKDGGLIQSNLPSTSLLHLAPADGLTHSYAVKAVNADSILSAASNAILVKQVVKPVQNTPSTLGPTEIYVSWVPAAGADDYDVELRTRNSAPVLLPVQMGNAYLVLDGLTTGKVYEIRVIGTNIVGSGSSASSDFRYTTTSAVATASPTGLVVTSASNPVTMSWNPVMGAASYNVFRKTGAGAYLEIATDVAGTSFSDGGAVSGTTYTYAVSSWNGNLSGMSNAATVTVV